MNSILRDEPKECISGWTKWFNRDKPKSTGFRSDIEQLPSIIEMLEYEGSPVCEQDMIADIKCRTVDTKMSYKDVSVEYISNLKNYRTLNTILLLKNLMS